MAILHGNLAPLRWSSSIRPEPDTLQHIGRALCSDSVEDSHRAIDDPNLRLVPTILLVSATRVQGRPGCLRLVSANPKKLAMWRQGHDSHFGCAMSGLRSEPATSHHSGIRRGRA